MKAKGVAAVSSSTTKLIGKTGVSSSLSIGDPNSKFFASNQETGHEWALFKENVRPLKRGRNLIEDIEYSGLLVIYEQCVRKFWHAFVSSGTRSVTRMIFKDDLRYLKVWLEYAEHCADAEVICKFLEVNEIGKTHALSYIAYAIHMEFKSKVKTANEIFNLGISRNAKPVEKLIDAYKKFMVRTMRRFKTADEEPKENDLPSRSFGTILSRGDNHNAGRQVLGPQAKNPKPNHIHKLHQESNLLCNFNMVCAAHPGHLYLSTQTLIRGINKIRQVETEYGSWLMLGGRAERNKENNSLPGKWKTFKVPQKPIVRTPASSFKVFVDNEEECTEDGGEKKEKNETNSSSNALSLIDGQTELLRHNPLRHFPPNSFLR
ncbi:hypothetical protein Bca52824_022458 [Brassica carinata]|uniref:BUB1 N-terminal domain-containing protein n=1 Tax=Brassica carinata TaxID=52824 RepID=A0A8X7VGL5_BRACI|nr:hypothetical protein Bca52824_022458 [Brassica carinata]